MILMLLLGLSVLSACSAPQAQPETVVPVPLTAAVSATDVPAPTSVPTEPPTVAPPTILPVGATSTPVPTATTEPTDMDAVEPFGVRLGQYYLDTAGFGEMATVLSDTQKIDLSFRTRVARIRKVLAHMPLPAVLQAQGQAFHQTLEDFFIAMRDNNAPDAIVRAAAVEDARKTLSAEIDSWLQANPKQTAGIDPFYQTLVEEFLDSAALREMALSADSVSSAEPSRFETSIAQYYLDSAGFHDMAEQLAKTETIDPAALPTVTRVAGLLEQVTWTPELDAQAQSFLQELHALADELREERVQDAITASDTVHDAQHALSQAIDKWLGGEAAGH